MRVVMKLCECGCGLPSPIAKANHALRGYVKGQPFRFIAGHQNRSRHYWDIPSGVERPKKWQRIDRKTCIYALIDPETGFVRYVGKTTQKLRSRLACHMAHAKNLPSDRWAKNWVRSLLDRGLLPEIVELETIEAHGDWAEAECFWIDTMRSWGFKLCNLRPGGEAGNFTKQSAETVEKRVSKLRGRPGRKLTEEQKAKSKENFAKARITIANWSPARRQEVNARKAARLLTVRRLRGKAHPMAHAVWIDGKIYDTVADAYRQLKVTRRTIYNWLRDGAAQYVDRIQGTKPPMMSEFRRSRPRRGAVVVGSKEYPSMRYLARKLGVSASTIAYRVRHGLSVDMPPQRTGLRNRLPVKRSSEHA